MNFMAFLRTPYPQEERGLAWRLISDY